MATAWFVFLALMITAYVVLDYEATKHEPED